MLANTMTTVIQSFFKILYGIGMYGVLLVIMSKFFQWIWNSLAPIYMYWLPEVFHNLPYWHTVGLLIIITVLTKRK